MFGSAGSRAGVGVKDARLATIPGATTVVNVRNFGAKGKGADETACFQGALDAVKRLASGTLRIPAGNYVISRQLSYDISALANRFGSRLRIIGDGSAVTSIVCAGLASAALAYTGATGHTEAYLHLEGFRLTGNLTAGSTGISISRAAFGSTDDLVIEAFDRDLDCTDVEQTQFSNSNFRWGNNGVRFNASGGDTSPNSLVFVNCSIANNSATGLTVTNANALTMVGGSIQYNGTTGTSGNYGAKITEAGDGYGTVNFLGVAFEGNGGDGDLISSQTTNPAIFNVIGCGFSRPNSSNYATNFLSLLGSNANSIYRLSGNTFRGFNTYSPNAGRPYIGITNTSAKIFDDGSNYYGSATEQPSWAGSARISAGAVFGAGGSPIGTFAVHTGTDKNFYIDNNFNLTDGVAFGSINDANNNLLGMEFRAGEVLFTAAGGVRSNGGAIGYKTGAGGAVTQATSKSTGVTLNKVSGQITMNAAALAAGTIVSFVLTNTNIAAGDVLILNHVSGGTLGAYSINASCASGSATIYVRNNTGGSLSEALVIGFVLIKGATS
jgi:hypothetical protein